MGGIVSGGIVGPKEAPVMLATAVVIVATLAQAIWMKLNRQKIDLMLWINLAVVMVLGGLAIWLHNEVFIKWKPSIAVWLMGFIFWFSNAFLHKNLLRQTLGHEIVMSDGVWQRLNFSWVAFFGLMGLINVLVVYTFSTDGWAKFHTFGSTGLTILFVIGQGLYLSKHIQPTPATDKPAP